MPTPPTTPHTPICPKCGYDQSGTIATWTDRCPLQGTCPECGFEFKWVEVLVPDYTRIPWYSEHASTLPRALKRTIPTLLRLIFPTAFWSQIPVTSTIKLSMLIKWCVSLIIASHLVASIFAGLGRWRAFDEFSYGSFGSVIQRGIMSIIEIGLNALFAPLFTISGTASGSTNIQWGSPYYEYSEEYIVTFTLALGASLLWQVIMTAIPATRRIAKLRSAHITRATILSLTQLFMVFEMGRAIYGLDLYFYSRNTWAMYLIIALTFLAPLWQLIFWPSAIISTWEIRPAAALILLGTIASVLGAMVTSLLIMNLFN